MAERRIGRMRSGSAWRSAGATAFGVLAVLAVLAIGGCAKNDVTTGTGTDDRISMMPRSVSIQVGQAVRMIVTITDDQGRVLAGKPVTFSVRDSAIATVTIDQDVVGLSPGTTIVSAATSQGHVAHAQVTVTPKP